MQPFRKLVKVNSKFTCDDNLDKIFNDSKAKIVSLVEEGTRTSDTSHRTCLQTDWSKDGIVCPLLQQYCECILKMLLFVAQMVGDLFLLDLFTTPTEAGYSPKEDESLAVARALDNARMFVLGCRDLTVSTDHKPLLGIFHDRNLSSIPNDRISSLKENTFRYQFSIQFCPGKWHWGPDAVSRNPSISTVSLISIIRQPTSIKDLTSLITLQEIQDAYKSATPLPYINLSPTQILFHCQLRNHIPANPIHYKLHKDWIISANQCEKALAQRNKNIAKKYNVSIRQLPEVHNGTTVAIQEPNSKGYQRWVNTGIVIEILPHCQYHIRLDGSNRITLTNKHFIKPITPNLTKERQIFISPLANPKKVSEPPGSEMPFPAQHSPQSQQSLKIINHQLKPPQLHPYSLIKHLNKVRYQDL